MRAYRHRIYAAAGAVVTIAYFLVAGPVGKLVFWCPLGLSSGIAVVLGVRWNRPSARGPWYLVAAGLGSFAVGDVISYSYPVIAHQSQLPYPSPADPFYLAMYVFLLAGLWSLARQRTSGSDRNSLVDAGIITTGLGLLVWVLLVTPYVRDGDLTVVQRLVSIAYPLGDVAVLAVLVRLLHAPGARPAAFKLMTLSVVPLLGADVLYGWLTLIGKWQQGGVVDIGWILFYVSWGMAALHPSMGRLTEPGPAIEARLGRGRLAALAAASLMAPAVLAAQAALHSPIDAGAIALASMVLFGLVVVRMAGLVRASERTAEREQVIRAAGAALVAAPDRASTYDATLSAVGGLVGALPVHIVVAAADAEEQLLLVADSRATGRESLPQPLLPLPAAAEVALSRRASVILSDVPANQLPDALGWPTPASVLLVPLLVLDRLHGALVLASPDPLPAETRDAIRALSTEVALAMESRALSEDLHERRSEARFRSLVQRGSDLIAVVSADRVISYQSPSVNRLLGFPDDRVAGGRITELVHPDDVGRLVVFLEDVIAGTAKGLVELRLRHADDSWHWVETVGANLLDDPNVAGIVLTSRDVTERKTLEAQLTQHAFHDPLTGLANRRLFGDRVKHALERRDSQPITVLFIDLDDFKNVNDSLGHVAGDRLLLEVAERLGECVRHGDTVARLGGDEFAVLLEVDAATDVAIGVAERVIAALARPVTLSGTEVMAGASVGIASGQPGAAEPEDLLRNADLAMYMAKGAGKGRYRLFHPTMHTAAVGRLELIADLRRALEREEFILQFQPTMQLADGAMTGVEALVRWQHPTKGLLPPAEFIPVAEETGLIVPLGRWVLLAACREAVSWSCQEGRPPITVSVNLAPRQLAEDSVVADVSFALAESGLDAKRLVLEITETGLIDDSPRILERLHALKAVGVRLAVDDFGTGYSSLSYLRRFPIDVIKVDKSFVDGIAAGTEAAALVRAILELAKTMRLQTVAEGIELADQIGQLRQLGCELGQGYYLSVPLDPDAIHTLLDSLPDGVPQMRPAADDTSQISVSGEPSRPS